jgi:hypothetical protein
LPSAIGVSNFGQPPLVVILIAVSGGVVRPSKIVAVTVLGYRIVAPSLYLPLLGQDFRGRQVHS